MMNLILLIAFLFVAPTTRPAAKLPERMEIALSDSMWQALPGAVSRVYVGPDDRVWYLMSGGPRLLIDDVKKLIEREFTQKNPQIYKAKLALFEPVGKSGGRVWFYFGDITREGKSISMLIGYDGKTWIERDVSANKGYRASPDNHALNDDQGVNVFCDGKCFFAIGGVVLVFDGKEFSEKDFVNSDKQGARNSNAMLQVESDGKGVIALINRADNPLWRWRDGKWSPLPVPPQAYAGIQSIAPAGAKGAWLLLANGHLAFAAFDAAAHSLTDWVKALGGKLPEDRNSAAAALTSMGPVVADRLREISTKLHDDLDANAQNRLDEIITELSRRPGNSPWGKSIEPSIFGPFTIERARFLFADDRGHIFTGGAKVSRSDHNNGKPEPAFVMLDSDGDYLAQWGEAMASRWKNLTTDWGAETIPLIVRGKENARAVWMPGDRKDFAAALFDVKKGRIVGEAPDPKFHFLMATKSDGTLFITDSNEARGTIMALRPGAAADDRAILSPLTKIETNGAFCIADDGAITTMDTRKTLFQFDAKHNGWQAVPRRAGANALRRLIAGKDGCILAQESGEGWSFISPPNEFSAPSLDELLQTHHDKIAKSFAGAEMIGYDAREPSIAFDDGGNIWISRRPDLHLRVLVKGDWIDASDQLKANGLRRGYVTFLARIGEGRSIYMTDYGMRHDGGGSLIGRVENGKLVFKKAPHCISEDDMPRPIREPVSNALWIAASEGFGAKTSDVITAQCATRITEDGVDEPIKGQLPLLADRSGNVWTLSTAWDGNPKVSVWRDRKCVTTFQVAGVDNHSRFFSDRLGSVWSWTKQGLQHYVEEAPETGKFKADKLYSVRGIGDFAKEIELTPKGQLVFLGAANDHQTLFVIDLPK